MTERGLSQRKVQNADLDNAVGDDLPGVPQNVEFMIIFGGEINFKFS